MSLFVFGLVLLMVSCSQGTPSVNVKRLDNGLFIKKTESVKLVSAYWRLIIIIKPPFGYDNRTTYNDVTAVENFITDCCDKAPRCHGNVRGQLEERIRYLQTLILNEEHEMLADHRLSQIRTKRGLFNAGGWLLGKLFGVATNRDVQQLREAIQDGYHQRQTIKHKVNQLVSSYNQLNKDQNRTRGILQRHEALLQQTKDDINGIALISAQNQQLGQRNHKTLLVSNLVQLVERRHALIQAQIDRYRSQRMALEAGRLTESILPRSDLKQVLTTAISKGYQPATMEWYYEHSIVRPVWETDEGFSYIVELPLYTQQVTGYDISSRPTLQTNGNWVNIVAHSYIGYNEQDGTITKLRGCQGHYPTLCESDLIYRTGLPCERSLVTGNSNGISKCNVRIETPKETSIRTVDINQHILTTLDTFLESRCQDEVTSRFNITPGTHLVTFDANNCQLQGSSGWILDSVDVQQEKLVLQDIVIDMSEIDLPSIPKIDELTLSSQYQLHQIEGIPINTLQPIQPLHPLQNFTHGSVNSYAIIGIAGLILLFSVVALILFMKSDIDKARFIRNRFNRIAKCACCSKKKEEIKYPDSNSLNITHSRQHLVVPPPRPDFPDTLDNIRKQYDIVNPILPAPYAPTYAILQEKDNNVPIVTTKF